MGLSIEVGELADLLHEDSEGAIFLYEAFESINEVLIERHLPLHCEPETLPSLDNRAVINSFPYSYLHCLRRVAGYAAEYPGWAARPFEDAEDSALDPLAEKQSVGLRSHLLCHSDCEGFYLPIEFEEVILDVGGRIPGDLLGSSFRLKKDLGLVAPALRLRLVNGVLPESEAARINTLIEAQDELWIEIAVWFSLFEAARLSIAHRCAISFS